MLDSVMAGDSANDDGGVSYPDLSSYRAQTEQAEGPQQPASHRAARPGTFTFRSDHTINFGSTSPAGFGSSPGQSSVRQVRSSILPTVNMPGSFPNPTAAAASSSPNKENVTPPPQPPSSGNTGFKALPHGMIQKKRHRVSTDEEDAEREQAERAAKRRKDEHVPEGDALLAPRLAAQTPGGASNPNKKPVLSPGRKLMRTPRGAGTPSPKKGGTLSISRLNMLARPKMRK